MAKGSALGESILTARECAAANRLIFKRSCHAKEFQLTAARLHVKRK